VIVAVTVVGMMQVTTDEIVNVIPVRYRFMPTVRAVSMPVIVALAVMIRRASTRIQVAHRN